MNNKCIKSFLYALKYRGLNVTRKTLKTFLEAAIWLNGCIVLLIYTRTNEGLIEAVLYGLLIVLIAKVLLLLINSFSTGPDGIPIPHKCFTRKDENGNVIFNTQDTFEAMVYLGEVEEFLKGKGKI